MVAPVLGTDSDEHVRSWVGAWWLVPPIDRRGGDLIPGVAVGADSLEDRCRKLVVQGFEMFWR